MLIKIDEEVMKILNEGDLVSFADFKKKKYGENPDIKPFQKRTLSQEEIDEIMGEILGDSYKQEEPVEDIQEDIQEDVGKDLPAKNYKKNPMDVEVGDILVCVWGYSMRLVDYYRVISKTKSSIKLEKLEGRRITDDGWTGTEVPTDKVEKDDRVDGKSFRIIPPEKQYMFDVDDWNVCKINGNYVEFWDGKPRHFDTLD